MSDFSSYLIGKLVKILSNDEEKSLEKAVNIIKNAKSKPPQFSISIFQTRWISELSSKGNFAQIDKLQRNINILKKIPFSQNLFYLLDLLKNSKKENVFPMQFISDYDNFYQKKEEQIPRDFLNVLQGFSGENFTWSLKEQKFILKDIPQPHLLNIAKKVNEVGQIVKYLSSFRTKVESLIFQKAYTYVYSILEEHLSNVIVLSEKIDTLTITDFTMFLRSQTIENMRAATIICNTIYDLKGGVLYNKLASLVEHGDSSIHNVAKKMAELAFSMIEEMIKEWITSGYIIDTFDEFFIQVNQTFLPCSKWWNNKYSLVEGEIPNTLSKEQINDIFETGKILNFFRSWDHAVNLEIDEKLPLDEYISKSAEKANLIMIKLLLDHNMKVALHDIYDYVLLERGDFAFRFLALDDAAKHIQIGPLAEEIAKHPIRGFDLKISNSRWSFSYQIEPPLSAILNQDIMDAYYAISSVLLSLKRTEFKITRCRQMFKDDPEYCVIIFEMIHFISLVLDYFHQQIIKRSFQELNEKIDKATRIDDILNALRVHKNEMVRGCWCSKSGRDAQQSLMKVLETIDALLDTDKSLNECLSDFHQSLIDFRDITRNHKAGGSELSRSLTRLFNNVLA